MLNPTYLVIWAETEHELLIACEKHSLEEKKSREFDVLESGPKKWKCQHRIQKNFPKNLQTEAPTVEVHIEPTQ